MDDKAPEKGLRLFDGHFNPIIWIDFTPKISTKNNIPNMYSESDQVKAKMDESEKKMETVVKEMQLLKTKREKGPLTKNDSLRIEYLFNQYQTLKNGH